MTGNELLRTVLMLMGYTDASGEPDSEAARSVARNGLTAIRQIYAELAYAIDETPQAIVTLSEPIALPRRLLDEVMPYGVAMLLAIGEGDANAEAAFSLIYNRKRTLLTHGDQRSDVLP
ncbi:MAG: hypothetical protein IJC17_05465 [Clostridia bacterium]|nr:hypothetical protein [Clostridia bacterium]